MVLRLLISPGTPVPISQAEQAGLGARVPVCCLATEEPGERVSWEHPLGDRFTDRAVWQFHPSVPDPRVVATLDAPVNKRASWFFDGSPSGEHVAKAQPGMYAGLPTQAHPSCTSTSRSGESSPILTLG